MNDKIVRVNILDQYGDHKSGRNQGFPFGDQVSREMVDRWRDGVDLSTVKKLIVALETKN